MTPTTHLHHIALGARDPATLSSFYSGVLGLTEVDRHLDDEGALRSVWHDLGHGALLMIERLETEFPDTDDVAMCPGLFLLAITIPATERAAWEARLEQAGCTIEARTPYSSYARDPENNRFAISHYPHSRL